jgi:hypothetical protein
MKDAMIVVLLITTLISIFKWIMWKISANALVYYMKKNQHKRPTKEELKECADFATRQMFKKST